MRGKGALSGTPTPRPVAEPAGHDYADLYEFAPVGYFAFDADGLIREVNETGARMLGMDKRLLVDQSFSRFVDAEDRERFQEHQASALRTSTLQAVEIKLRRKDGTHFFAELQSIMAVTGRNGWCRTVLSDVTARKTAERMLKESEERYRSLVESSPEAIGVLQDGKIVYLNPVGLTILGTRNPAEVIGKNYLDFVHPDFRESAGERSRIVEDTGIQAPVREIKILRHDGSTVDVESTATRITFNGNPAVQFIVKDITGRKQAELNVEDARDAALHERRRLETILNIIPSGVFVAEGGVITLQNEQARNIMGWDLESVTTPDARVRKFGLRKPDGKFFEPDELPGMRAVRTGKVVRDVEMIVDRPDGRQIRVLSNAVPLRDEAGKVIGSVNSVSDITKRKEAEETLQEAYDELDERVKERTTTLSKVIEAMKTEIAQREKAEDKLKRAGSYNRSLIEASLDPLVTIGPDGKITDVNAATEIATGRVRDELIGADFSEYFTDPGKARAGYQQVFREGKVMDYALEIRHRNGHVTPVLYNASLYRDEAGQVTGVFAAARDITERKEIQDRLIAMNNVLQLLSHGCPGTSTSTGWSRSSGTGAAAATSASGSPGRTAASPTRPTTATARNSWNRKTSSTLRTISASASG